MAVDRRLHLRFRHRAEPRRALTAGAVAGVVALVLPVELLEVIVASSGLSEAVPALAPPMAWGARIGSALLIALIVSGLGWVLGGLAPLFGRRKMTIAWSRSLRWDSLTRMARGIDNDAPRNIGAPSFAVPTGLWSDVADSTDWQPRRRADLHPDAPPRPPIVASRDLPAIDPVARPARPANAGMPPVVSVPVRDLISKAGSRPMPRAPQPLSEAQLDAIRALLTDQDKAIEAPSRCDMPPAAEDDADILDLSVAGMIVTGDLPLSSLLDRFEQQVERKIAIDDSMKASSRISATVGTAVPETDEGLRPEADAALRTALETLKALSQHSH